MKRIILCLIASMAFATAVHAYDDIQYRAPGPEGGGSEPDCLCTTCPCPTPEPKTGK